MLVTSAAVRAELTPASLFTDDMVLQQKQTDPVWGKAEPNEMVTVAIHGQSVKTTAGADGNWSVRLQPMDAGGPFEMTIAGAKDTVTLKNVLVGEVWICSGQSNMEYPMEGWGGQPAAMNDALAASADPLLRFGTVRPTTAATPQSAVECKWRECTPDNIKNSSAVSYHFGSELRKKLGVPVGLICCYFGGTEAECWTSREALQSQPELKLYLDMADAYATIFFPTIRARKDAEHAQHKLDMEKYAEALAAANAAGATPPVKPKDVIDQLAPPGRWKDGATNIFNGMIAPIAGFGMRGVIWYQGEGNADAANAANYRTLFPTMIADWRKRWEQGDFPFLFVQLAPFGKIRTEPITNKNSMESNWAELREAQRLTLAASPQTGMVVITDLGAQNDLHPKRKVPIGERLARLARALAYGEKVESSGPAFSGKKIEGSTIRIDFAHAEGMKAIEIHDALDDGPLVAAAGKLVGFEIAGADQKYVVADAMIAGATVVVSSASVPKPVAVRYGWSQYPLANLSNSAGLPASPFKTDAWPWTTSNAKVPEWLTKP